MLKSPFRHAKLGPEELGPVKAGSAGLASPAAITRAQEVNDMLARRVEVGPAISVRDFEQSLELRESSYRDSMQHLLHQIPGAHPALDRFDSVSYHFCARARARVVACGRLSRSSPEGRWEIPELAELIASFPDSQRRLLILNRGVVSADLRNSGLLSIMLHAGSRWALEHTEHTSGLAIVSPEASSFYRRLGIDSVGEIALPSRQGRRYAVIHAPLAHIAERLGQYACSLGWVLGEPDAGGNLLAIAPSPLPPQPASFPASLPS